MARTPSNSFPIGTKAPDFKLPDTVSGKQLSFQDVKGDNGTAVFFICNHCPFVKHVNHELAKYAKDYLSKGIKVVAISANDVENYPEDAPHLMKELAKNEGFIFPYLYDETQEIAKAYDAACTPDLYLFDQDNACFYHGQLDASRPGNDIPVTGKDLRAATDALLKGEPHTEKVFPSIGCNIKWKN